MIFSTIISNSLSASAYVTHHKTSEVTIYTLYILTFIHTRLLLRSFEEGSSDAFGVVGERSHDFIKLGFVEAGACQVGKVNKLGSRGFDRDVEVVVHHGHSEDPRVGLQGSGSEGT